MQIKLSLTVCEGAAESNLQPLLTLELESQPRIETLGLSLANGKAALARLQALIVTRQVELMSASQRRCESCGLNRGLKDSPRRSLPQPVRQGRRARAQVAAM